MIKRIFKILLIICLVIIGLLLGVKWIITEAFGPKYRIIEIELNENRTLKCQETYNADLAAVFYDVEFTLIENDKEEIKLGQTTFLNENWDKGLKLLEFRDWIILPIKNGSYAKIIITNRNLRISKDTTFSPLELRYDKNWKEKYNDIPAWVYGGKSKIDSIVENRFYINYEYRVGINKPFEFYNQTIEYEMELGTGKLLTKTIFERKEK